jgi:hypothetical protein
MNRREFYTKALLASVPTATYIALQMGQGNPLYEKIEKDIKEGLN